MKEFIARGEFIPSEYMRCARPELFSDSVETKRSSLTKEYLEYHLDTMTSRKHEQPFEAFCLRLAELEICPNLKPQTGSTGGGDSKTDASTYPVAAALIERCYWGTPNPPADENWAFAFSCMKRWKTKAKSDLQKIADIDRSYTTAYFISSRFIRDKERAATELVLGAKHGFEVHILDRTWILQKVFGNGREEVAIESLGLTPSLRAERRIGPRDTGRQQEYDGLMTRLASPFEFYASDYILAGDYQRAALLARGLEKPRHEIEGLFHRSVKLARKHGDPSQLLRCLYDHAWTSHWWYDDTTVVATAYAEIEVRLSEIGEAEQIEMLRNLLMLLLGAARAGTLPLNIAKTDMRTAAWMARAEVLSAETYRPNNALHCECMLWMVRMAHSWTRQITLEKVQASDHAAFDSLFPNVHFGFAECCKHTADCFGRSGGLLTFPLRSMINELAAHAEMMDRVQPEFEELYEQATKLVRQREGEAAEGDMLLERGIQILKLGLPSEALVLLGKARSHLGKRETLQQALRAGMGCSDAYATLECYWASRMEALLVAHVAVQIEDGEMNNPVLAFFALRQLCSCELSLGRIGPFLAWFELFCIVGGVLAKEKDAHAERISRYFLDLEGAFAGLILNLDEASARRLKTLGPALVRLGMRISPLCLRYACGDKTAVSSAMAEDFGIPLDQIPDLIANLRQGVSPTRCESGIACDVQTSVHLSTKMLGVEYVVESENEFGPVIFAENLLAVIEAMLVLARWEYLAFVVSTVRFRILQSTDGRTPPNIDWERFRLGDGIELRFAPDLDEALVRGDRQAVTEWLHELMLTMVFVSTIDPHDDIKNELNRWGEEGTFTRALGVSPTGSTIFSLVGKSKYDISYWCSPAAASPVQ